MKLLLLLIVSTFAVFTVDCRDIPDDRTQNLPSGPELQDSALQGSAETDVSGNQVSAEENKQDLDGLEVYNSENEEKELNYRNLVVAKGTDDVEFPEENDSSAKQTTPEEDSSEEDEDASNSRKLRRSQCKARNACVVMAGFCVTNATLCTGRLVSEGCKGTNCQCCVPGTLKKKIEELEDEIESMQTNLNGAKLNINMTLKIMEDKILDSISNISSKLDNYMEHAATPATPASTATTTTTATTTATATAPTGCPQGFFTAGSRQCFKYFNATRLNWAGAKAKCQREGLVLAKPIDPVALRNYVKVFNTGSNRWIGGRGAGSYFIWDRDGQQISNTNSLWWPGSPGSYLSTSYCLAMSSSNSYPTKAFIPMGCTNARPFVCERVMN